MKRFIRTAIIPAFAAAGLMTSVAVVPTVAGAQTLKPATIAVLDQRRLLQDSLVSKDIANQFRTISNGFLTEENNIKNGLMKEKEDLEKQRPIIGEQAFAQKFDALSKKADNFNRKADIHQKQLNVAQARAQRDLNKVLGPIIQQVADGKGATVVLERSQLVHVGAGLDLTTEVMERLNKQLPTLKVSLPTEAEILEMENKARAGQ